MWQEVREKAASYRLLLQNLYAEVDSSQRNDRSKIQSEFALRLARDYPGSRYFGAVGALAVNNYTTIFFDASWNISQLKQKFGSLEKAYDFRSRTLTITDGANRIGFRIESSRPEKSQFTVATIPAITVDAEQVWAKRIPPAHSYSPLKDLLNEAYANRVSNDGVRMDQLAESLVRDAAARVRVLQIAEGLYDRPETLKEPLSQSPSFASPKAFPSFTASSFISSVLKSIPWYGYFILFLGFMLRIATPVLGKRWLLQVFFKLLKSRRNPRQGSDYDWHGADDAEENWFGEGEDKSRSSHSLPQGWSAQVLRSLKWKRFETVCSEYLRMVGYDPRETKIGADGGVDIWVYKSGSEKPAGIVQCKAWTTYKVGVKPVRELFGVMAAEGVANGKFITSGEFTAEALEFAKEKRLELISGEAFLAWIRKLSPEKQTALLTVALEGDYRTPTCPQCGVKMTARQRGDSNRKFWGCPRYPKCRATLVYKERE